MLVFSLEYVMRLWVCTERGEFADILGSRFVMWSRRWPWLTWRRFCPFTCPCSSLIDARMLRLIRLVRLLRLLKVIRYSESWRVFTDFYRMKKSELAMVFLVVLFLLVFASAVIYHVEQEAQPVAFSSIPAAMWWGVATLTTVGYGDIYPVTPLGKFFGAIIALLGIGLFALPAGILGSGFVGALRRKSNSTFYCPHCSDEITRK